MYRGALLCSVVCVRNSHSRVRVLYSLFRFQCSSKQFLSFHAFYRGIHDQSNFKQASLSMKIIFASINSRFFSSLSFLREFFLILYPGNLFLNPKMTFGFCFKMMVWVWGCLLHSISDAGLSATGFIDFRVEHEFIEQHRLLPSSSFSVIPLFMGFHL